MSGEVWAAVVSTVGLIVTGAFVYVQTRKGQVATDRLSQRVVDREEWESYTDRQDKERERLEKRIAELEERMAAEIKARQDAEQRAADAEARAERAEQRADDNEREIDRLRQRIEVLEETLRREQIPIPPDIAP